MSNESIFVHEAMHAWDHMNDPKGYSDKTGNLRNFFKQDEKHMGDYPNKLERRAVEEANSYRNSVNEPIRTKYGNRATNMKMNGVQKGAYSAIPGWGNRFTDFRKNRGAWNKANPENRFDHSGYIRGTWPKN